MVSIGLGISLLALPASLALAQELPPGDGSGGNTQPPEPVIDWQKKQDQTGRLSALGFGLLGEQIEPHTGGLKFEHTDVVLPGNSSLDVSVRRRIQTGGLYKSNVKAEFGDWELITPRIKVTTSSLSNYRTGIRCSMSNPLQTLQVPYPQVMTDGGGTSTVQMNRTTYSKEYSNGYTLDVPGYGAQPMRKNTNSVPSIFGSAPFVTASGWKIDCLNNITGGGQGYEATAPNGTIYRFDRFYELEATRLGFLGHTSSAFDRYVSIVAATQVTDIHGNTVDYTYDSSNRLTHIQGSDGRLITLSYTNGTDMISRVSANGRHWDYSYGTNSLTYWARYQTNTGYVGSYPTLTSVTQPDGLSWTMDMQAMSAEVPPALSCDVETFTVSLTHPHGTEGEFIIMPMKHKVTGSTLSPKPNGVFPGYCPNPEANSPNIYAGSGSTPVSQYYAPVWMMSTVHKELTSPSVPTMAWNYDYELDSSLWGPNDDQLNRTDVTHPDGTIHRYFHGWGTEYVTGNQLVKKQVVDNGAVVSETTNSLLWEGNFGSDGLSGGLLDFFPERERRIWMSVTQQDGDSFTSETQFNTDFASTAYSFGNPIRTESYSNVSATPRVFHHTYENNTANWILNLPKTLTLHDRQLYEYFYNSDGQKTSQSRYGQSNYYTFTYSADGTPLTATDALGRVTRATNWMRGSAQDIWQAYGTADQIYVRQYIDVNGWMTRQNDAMGNAHYYSHDNMGRLTSIDRPGPYSNTAFAYSFPGTGGAVQTTTRDNARTTVTYDSLLRPILTRTQALDTGWSSYVNTGYDAMGRVVFKSQPSISATETKGVDTTYDGLGRIYDITENVAPYAKTRHRYYSSHRHRIYDPSNAYTQYYSFGYGGPGNTDYSHIYKYDAANTALQRTKLYKNPYGQLIRLRKWGTHDGQNVDISQRYYYDSNQRLCRHFVPEHGSTKYEYNAAGEMIRYAKGQTNSGCTVPSNDSRVTQSYDLLGRPTLTNFQDVTTPDITRTYDDNGNVKTVNRGGVNWTYDYDALNLLTLEQLDIDGRNFDSAYTYNPSGFLTQKSQPNNRVINYTVDGLGRMTTVKNGAATLASNIGFHPSGALNQMDYANGQQFTQTLNDRLQPLRLRSADGGNVAIDQTFGYDARGLITSITDGAVSGNNRAYGYDGLRHLKTASGPWGAGSYSYDSLGNLRSKQLGARNVTLNYDATRNRLSQSIDSGSSGTRTVAYDGRGNVTTLGNLTFLYDMSDQPVAVSGTANGIGAANGNFTYDGNLKRVKAVVNGQVIYNVYDAGGSLVHIDAADDPATPGYDPKVTDYVTGPMGTLARITNGTVTYLHPDHLGSAQSGTDSSGGISWREQYTPFGEEIQSPAANDNLGGFTGHIRDKTTGLNYMQARYYDPVIGRFLSVDPVGFINTGDVGYFNRYAYTTNDPINMLDPDGKSKFKGAKLWAKERAKANVRRYAVKRAWREEKQLIQKTGNGTRQWTNEQKKELLETGKVNGLEGHHMNTVNGNSLESAADPNNVEFLTKLEHQAKHKENGGSKIPITGQKSLDRSIGGALPALPGRFDIDKYKAIGFSLLGGVLTRLDLVDPYTIGAIIIEQTMSDTLSANEYEPT